MICETYPVEAKGVPLTTVKAEAMEVTPVVLEIDGGKVFVFW